MLYGVRIDSGAFLPQQLYSAATNTMGEIIGGIITTIARSFGVQPNPKDRVYGSKQLDQAAFELMSFCKVHAGCLC